MNANNKNYSIRPLTDKERVFAADEGNYSYLFFYMRKMRLDPEEWYDILIIPYLDAVKKYHEYESARQYTFSTVLKNKLYSALTAELKKRKSKKRMPEGGICSLDYTLEGDNPFSENTLDELWIDRKQQTEKIVLDKEMLAEILVDLDDVQSRILKMLLEGYNNKEIEKELCISYTTLKNQLEKLQSVVTDYLSM
ncbi:MAG: hypothetical protein MR384_06810 [Lachnospiraceae bacterium]|nr:hypothetical protein [Lachnospiraceae bacterium]